MRWMNTERGEVESGITFTLGRCRKMFEWVVPFEDSSLRWFEVMSFQLDIQSAHKSAHKSIMRFISCSELK
jgi:hypothetical protein